MGGGVGISPIGQLVKQQEQRNIPSRIDDLERQTEILAKAVEIMEHRLMPVLAPTGPQNEKVAQIPSDLTQLGTSLASVTNRIQAARMRIEELSNRIEL